MGHFLLGFTMGAAIGAVSVVYSSRVRDPLQRAIHGALEAGRQAREAQEQALWSEFRTRANLPAQGQAKPLARVKI